MESSKLQSIIKGYDERRNIARPGGYEETVDFAVQHLLDSAKRAIAQKGLFSVALSGGSTPKAIFSALSRAEKRGEVDWKRVLLFWSDERLVPPDHPDSNYRMAMEAGLSHLPIPLENIHRMRGEEEPEAEALKYEKLIGEKLQGAPFDLVTLGMGNDGHTASLFPKTHALHSVGRKVVANFIPKMECWRLTMTFECINEAKESAIYLLGEGKAATIREIFTSPYDPDRFPIQKIGTPKRKALFIMDDDAAKLMN